MTDTAGAPAAGATDGAAAAPAGVATHVVQTHQEGHVSMNAPAAGADAAAAVAAKAAESTPPDATAMRAYMADKAKDVSLEGKTDEELTALYTAAKAKEPAPSEFKLPDEYKDKPWAAKVKSLEDVYKQIDTLDTLKGKKSVVPNLKDATAEEREAFYSQLRGKDATEYVIPENPAFPTPPETQAVVAKLFMDNGVSPTQAEAIIKGYQELGATQLAQQFDPEGMKKSMETAFGPEWEKTTGAVRNTIKSMMNEDDQKALDHIPNNILGLVYRTMGNTIKAVNETLAKYGAKETFAHLNAPNGGVGPTDMNSQREGWRNELAALSSRPHTYDEQQVIIAKIAKSYENDPRLQQQG